MGIARTANKTTNKGHKLVAYHVTMFHWRAMPIPVPNSHWLYAIGCRNLHMVTFPESHHAKLFRCGVKSLTTTTSLLLSSRQ